MKRQHRKIPQPVLFTVVQSRTCSWLVQNQTCALYTARTSSGANPHKIDFSINYKLKKKQPTSKQHYIKPTMKISLPSFIFLALSASASNDISGQLLRRNNKTRVSTAAVSTLLFCSVFMNSWILSNNCFYPSRDSKVTPECPWK